MPPKIFLSAQHLDVLLPTLDDLKNCLSIQSLSPLNCYNSVNKTLGTWSDFLIKKICINDI